MMRPSLWREIFKDRMALMIRRIHDRGMKYVLHSCGHIVDLFDDFAEIGVDVLQLDQQRNMGLETLRDRLQKRTCLWCPADIQFTSGNHDLPAVEDYCAEMLRALAAPEGGFMYKPYPQPEAIAMPLVTLLAEIRFFKSARYPAEK
jgi:uroporphyrinogen-III decarboxylase